MSSESQTSFPLFSLILLGLALAAGVGLRVGFAPKDPPAVTAPAASIETTAPAAATPKLSRPSLESVLAAIDSSSSSLSLLVARFVGAAEVAELRQLAEKLDPKKHKTAFSFVLGRWCVLDSEGALRYARDKDRLAAAYAGWAILDFDAALESVEGEGDPKLLAIVVENFAGSPSERLALMDRFPDLRKELNWDAVVRALAHEDRELAFETALREETASKRQKSLKDIFAQWAAEDPDAALARAAGLSVFDDRYKMMLAVGEEIIANDLPRGRKLVEDFAPGYLRGALFLEVARKWADADPQAALAWVKANAKGAERRDALSAIALRLADSDPRAAIPLLDELGWTSAGELGANASSTATPGGGRSASHSNQEDGVEHAIKEVLAGIAETSPREALGLLAKAGARGGSIRSLDGLPKLQQNLIKRLVESDAAGTAAWLAELPDAGGVRETAEAFVKEWSNRDEGAATAFAESLDDTPLKSKLAVQIAGSKSESDPEGAFQWAKTLGGDAMATAMATAIGALAKADAEGAAARLPEIPEGDSRDAALATVGRQWAKSDYRATAEWLATVPSEPTANVYNEVTRRWLKEDAEEASQWVDQLPPSNGRDTAIGVLLNDMLAQQKDFDFASAAAWASQIGSSTTQGYRLKQVAEAWRQHQPEAAPDAIRDLDIPDAAKQILLNEDEN